MLNATLILLKLGALALYTTTLLAWSAAAGPELAAWRELLLAFTGALVLAHLCEYGWVRGRLAAADPDGRGHLIQTLLFGFLHWLPIVRGANAANSQSGQLNY